jgi:hypothetical protein
MMQMSLFDWRKCASKRPDILSEEIAHATARACRDEIKCYLGRDFLNNDELDDAVKDVGRALHNDGYSDDAYKVCRCLESYSWGDGDDELHDMIENVIFQRRNIWHIVVIDWVKENGVVPCHKVGDVVKYSRKRVGRVDVIEGEITGISTDTAQYHVVVKGEPTLLDRVCLVNFEDVIEST